MRVLGIDPGLTRCGLGVVDQVPGRRAEFVRAGVIRTPSTQDHAYRLLAIERGIEEWVGLYSPDCLAVERVFTQHNLQTVAGTAQAAGIAMLIAARHDLPVTLHTPTEVKAAISGSGRADKAQVGLMVAWVLHLDAAPTPADAADAVALAVCHLWRGAATNRYAEAVERAGALETPSRVRAATRLRAATRRSAS